MSLVFLLFISETFKGIFHNSQINKYNIILIVKAIKMVYKRKRKMGFHFSKLYVSLIMITDRLEIFKNISRIKTNLTKKKKQKN